MGKASQSSITHRDTRRTTMLAGTALRPMAMLIAHSTPFMGSTLKKRPTGVCMMITCRVSVCWGGGGVVKSHIESISTAGKQR